MRKKKNKKRSNEGKSKRKKTKEIEVNRTKPTGSLIREKKTKRDRR